MFDQVLDLIGSAATAYPLIFGVVAVDAFFPVVPGETSVITGAILAAQGDLFVGFVFLCGWAGAFAGDNVSFWLGRSAGRRAARRLFRGERSQRTLEWAKRQIEQRGPTIIVGARFIPGGRTATTFAAGTLDMPWRRFAAADLLGGALWAAMATALGYFGGEAFRDSLWKPLLIATGLAALVSLAGEGWRRTRAA